MANVREFILNDTENTATLTNTGSKPRQKTAARQKTVVEYEIVLQDGPDAVLRRKTKTTSRLLVLIMTKRQFYIKDEKSGTITPLDNKTMKRFMSGISDEINLVPWSFPIKNDSYWIDRFCSAIGTEAFCYFAVRGLYKFSSRNTTSRIISVYEKLQTPVYKAVCKVLKRDYGNEFLNNTITDVINGSYYAQSVQMEKAIELLDSSALGRVEKAFSLDAARDFAEEFLASPGVRCLPSEYSLYSLLDEVNFEPKRFIEYIFHESVRQGYGDTRDNMRALGTFVLTWLDVLRMQVQLRGRVYDKYPKYLDSMHRELSYKCSLLRATGNPRKFAERLDELSKHSKTDDMYLIRPPMNGEDMVCEAQQQSNCLASYITVYQDGVTDIYFMRHVSAPEESLVTVEVRDGAIRQAYRASNEMPTEREIDWLNQWANENGFGGVPSHYHPMCA